MDTLPAEILIEIFNLCTTDPAEPLVPLNLSCVSTWWREVVQSSPRIWQYIHLDDRSTLAFSRAQVALWTRRSYPLSFDITLDVAQSSNLILPLLSPLLPFMDRWRHFTMTGLRQESVVLSGSLADGIDPLIISLQDPDQAAKGSLRRTFAGMAPEWLAMNIWVSELPQPLTLLPMHFTAVVMSEHSLSIHTQPRSILEFLSMCPQLVAFSFAGWHHDDEERMNAPPLPVVRLPELRKLHLRTTCGTRSLLSCIDAPGLTELYLASLNVDFQLALPIEEDGDSDDEAGDFSRSPGSDRATGMGLRRLLLRSNPPLRVLHMDWSDMRTKDFRFAFDHLSSLEWFFISASDMSDRVIELLRPFSSVRLPMLRRLELINCNELSGEVILQVLSARVAVTDTLSELAIIQCEGFTEQHAALLRKDFRGTLETSREAM
ncbi:hypothetical protein FB45DRAFT_896885 [Roridomyces roridus]|uniref:F-box domain-containing protein n=1 Tax=Roridomyces roridus TaxID=1738132 RepID=A0AAD7CBE8_9AGAR|nr:hypothetical protein FB45DRAFT_896885 [Roridomyces roridus]